MVRMVLLHWLESMVVIIMVRSVALPGSSSNDIRNLTTTSNVEVPGLWIYRVDSSDIIAPAWKNSLATM